LVSLHDLNDIDYINTRNKNNSTLDKKLITSQLKYFYNTNNLYADIDFKYYKDTSKYTKHQQNTTMQQLPKINIHKYSNETFLDKLIYSIDIKHSIKTRKLGLKANETNIIVPFVYSFDFFNDYLNFSYTNKTSLTKLNYGNNYSNYKNGYFIENDHIFTLSTSLLKPYKDYIHSIDLKTSLTIPDIIKDDGDLYSINTNDTNLKIFPVEKTRKNINFSLSQSIYNKNNISKIINHKINQMLIYDETQGKYKLSNLENKVILYYKYGEISNRFLYNHDDNIIINSSTTASFNKDDFNSKLYYNFSKDKSHKSTKKKTFSYKDLPDAKSITLDLGYKFKKYYKVSYKQEYDLAKKYSKKIEYNFGIDKKCWAFDIKLVDDLVASATTNKKAIRQNIFYLQIKLKPILSYRHIYIKKKKEQ
jgi:LPS-assembly protein